MEFRFARFERLVILVFTCAVCFYFLSSGIHLLTISFISRGQHQSAISPEDSGS